MTWGTPSQIAELWYTACTTACMVAGPVEWRMGRKGIRGTDSEYSEAHRALKLCASSGQAPWTSLDVIQTHCTLSRLWEWLPRQSQKQRSSAEPRSERETGRPRSDPTMAKLRKMCLDRCRGMHKLFHCFVQSASSDAQETDLWFTTGTELGPSRLKGVPPPTRPHSGKAQHRRPYEPPR